MTLTYRAATPDDTERIARLHAESWRRTYRGLYRDAYLDGDVFADRLAVWRARLGSPSPRQLVILAEDRGILAAFSARTARRTPAQGR